MKHGTQSRLAQEADVSPKLLNKYLKGAKNASAPIADRLAALTGTDIRVWLQEGSVEARRAAMEAWARESSLSPLETPDEG
jgi:plasmid maintenance system antidote protein VapI